MTTSGQILHYQHGCLADGDRRRWPLNLLLEPTKNRSMTGIGTPGMPAHVMAAALALDDWADRDEQASFDEVAEQMAPAQHDSIPGQCLLDDRWIRVVDQSWSRQLQG